ncbi:hypothetical protein [Cesiribacter sp. SM1]|uniref:hypothetical protein n=1 Tax=Cesiribacter sp. SM1 TaxID=2861196 RepID=UPI001CD780AB|nr:hypothetical protein [Cesiribacter sp. SM1]
MNKTIILATGFLLIFGAAVRAQAPAEIRLGAGYGSYSMGDLEALQENSMQGIGVNIKATERFPAYFNYSLRYLFKSKVDDHFGVVAEMGSTGGRIGYADYSGSYREDQLLRYRRIGVVVESYRALPKGFDGWLGCEASLLFSKLIYEGEISLTGAGSTSEHYTFYALGGAVQPYLALERKIGFIRLGAQAGVCLSLSEGFSLKEDRNIKLVNPGKSSEEVVPGWSGWRLSMYVGVPLSAGSGRKEN